MSVTFVRICVYVCVYVSKDSLCFSPSPQCNNLYLLGGYYYPVYTKETSLSSVVLICQSSRSWWSEEMFCN